MMMTILKREMQMVMKLLKIGTVFHLLTRLLAISINLGCIACKKMFRFFECFVNPNKAFKTAVVNVTALLAETGVATKP